jgi:hypothetical protein
VTSDNELSPEQLEIAHKIEKMLRMAADKSNPIMAERAMAKAEEWMRLYNLSTAAIEQNTGDKGKRSELKFKSGHKKWQQELWGDVAKLNFCLHFIVTERTVTYKTIGTPTGFKRVIDRERFLPFHRVVGRTMNVKATHMMAEYLEQAIERITRDECNERDIEYYSTDANEYRAGIAERVCEKLYDAQIEQKQREADEKLERERKAREEGRSTVSMERAITLSTYTKDEEEANKDFLDPERHARKAAEEARIAESRARDAKARAEAEAEWVQWCADNPEEAKAYYERREKERAEERKREEKNAKRRAAYVSRGGWSYRPTPTKGNPHMRRAGYEAGERVSIYKQADKAKPAGALS